MPWLYVIRVHVRAWVCHCGRACQCERVHTRVCVRMYNYACVRVCVLEARFKFAFKWTLMND